MHSRIIQISKDPKESVMAASLLPDWLDEYADYVIPQSPADFDDDFRWAAECSPGTNYLSSKSMLFFNADELEKEPQDKFSIYYFIPHGCQYYGITPDDCTLTAHDLGELLNLFDDDGIFYAISSYDYHF